MVNSKRRSILCPRCRRIISTDELRCPHCDLKRTASTLKNNLLGRSFFEEDRTIKILMGINIAVFIISIMINPRSVQLNPNPLTLLAPDDRSLLLLGATGTIPIDQLGRWWTLVSASYLHGGILHIFFNLMALGQILPLVQREFGSYRTIIIYTVGGIGGFYASYLAGISLTIGASAALCALLGAAVFYGKSRGGVYGQAVYRQIGGWAVFILIFGLIVPGINNWGHGGGFVTGILLGLILGYKEKRSETPIHVAFALLCIGITAAVLIWGIGTGIYYRFF